MALWAFSKGPWLAPGDGSVEGTVVPGLLAACPKLLTGVTSLCPHNCPVEHAVFLCHAENTEARTGSTASRWWMERCWAERVMGIMWRGFQAVTILLVYLALSFFAFFLLLICLALETPPHPRISQVCICSILFEFSAWVNETAVPKLTRRGLMPDYWFLD